MASVVAAWPTVALSEVLRKSDEWVDINPDTEYTQVTVRLWGKGVAQRGRVLGSQIAASRQLVVSANQFILSRIDARNGAFGLITSELDGAVVSNDFPVFNLDENRIIPAYLDWLSKTHDFVEMCQRASEGTTNRVRLKEDRFLGASIPLPPLDEQRRIVAHIEALAARIAEARGLRQAAMAEAEALWETGACSLLDAYPKTTYVPLGEVVTVQGGGTPSKSNSLFWVGDIPWISPKDMKVRHISDSHDHISVDAVSQSTAKLVEPGAVLIVTRGMILAHTIPIAVLQKAATINQDMKALSPLSGLSPEYLCNVLWALNHDLLQLVERSSHDTRKLETAKLLGFEIPLPDLTTQESLIARFENMRAEVQAIQESQSETSIELNALLPSLLDKAFRGKL